MEYYEGIRAFHAKSQKAWRDWLSKNHSREKSVWLIIYRKSSAIKSVYYPEAVDEALCFGWIDSKPNKRDEESYYLFFSKRSPKSNWSKVNKLKVEKLIAQGQMTEAGYAAIAIAKQNGTWEALDKVEQLIVPDDLQALFNKNKQAFTYWQQFAPSSRRGILDWINNAKRPETRAKRIEETVRLASQNEKANQYVRK
ncbi:MAG: hypothetical protein EBR30_25120 [Cytophagia bacterium]|nr:hypothetical protein [Cytophagia bacterium]